MADSTPKSYSTDPALYLYTSLTSGSSHIVTATSRLETILKANKIPFKALDIATDEKARMLWGRRAGKDETGRARKIPGLVQMGLVIGDLVEIEEWNEYGELRQHVKIVKNTATKSGPSTPLSRASDAAQAQAQASSAQENAKPTPTSAPTKTPASVEPSKAEEVVAEPAKPPAGAAPTAISLALRQAGKEAAQKAKDSKKAPVKTYDGVGEAEPTTAEVVTPLFLNTVSKLTLVQDPATTTWSRASKPSLPTQHDFSKLESLQSPTSTAWKPMDVEPPILTHRGSSVSAATAEEIKKVEEECTIKEEDEEAVEE